ncbi:MAG TPA: diaminopimelate epimerase [Candidatus Dormibacteraeota bacterium]
MQRVVHAADSLELTKYEALGNDYLVVDDVPRFAAAQAAAPYLCDRHRGVGSDGVLLVDAARGQVRVINPDGSEAEKSGNGLRIATAHLVLAHGRSGSFTLHVPAGDVAVRVLGVSGAEVTAEIDLGLARVSARERLDPPGVEAMPVDLGNPHCVVFGEPVTAGRCAELGPVLEHHPRFPARTNVQLAEAPTRSTVHIEIWERGAGYTLASGTSAGAAAAACMAAGIVDEEVRVVMPGGSLKVTRAAGGRLLQTGPARRVFSAVVELP